jgi:cytochrome oxidase Cu insertion factor (SCO1/SenC/PrrC family)
MGLLPTDPVRRGRVKLLLLAALFAVPAVAGWLAYLFDWAPGTTSNYGELIEPRTVRGAPLEALRGKWVMVSFDAPACDAYCEKKLYFMRQVRKAQGRELARIERLWLLTAPGAPRKELLEAIEGTHVAPAAAAAPEAQFPSRKALADHIYLVDPLGNLMMRYPRDPDPSRMIRDLQRLLKYSRIG